MDTDDESEVSAQAVKPLSFPPEDQWPEAAISATPREKEILRHVVKLIEKYAAKIYEISLEEDHRKRKTVTEEKVIVHPKLREYLEKPGGPYEEIKEILKGWT